MTIITRDEPRVNSSDITETYRELGRWSPDLARMVEPVPQEASDRIDVLLADLEWDARCVRPDWFEEIEAEAERCYCPSCLDDFDDDDREEYERESVNSYLARRWNSGAAEEGSMYGMGYYT